MTGDFSLGGQELRESIRLAAALLAGLVWLALVSNGWTHKP